MISADHDVLIELRADVKNLNTNITSYMTSSTQTLADHEHRITSLEKSSEVNEGKSESRTDTRRNVLEIAGVIAAIISAYATYLLGHHH